MRNWKTLLPEVWRDASRHLEIQSFSERVAEHLGSRVGFGRLWVSRLDAESPALVTVAIASRSGSTHVDHAQTGLTIKTLQGFKRWCLAGEPSVGTSECSNLRKVYPYIDGVEVAAMPLLVNDDPVGAIVFEGIEAGEHNAWASLLRVLQEPFSVALENDRRLHEIASMREAAEAERSALLRRLGKSSTYEDTIIGSETGLRGVMDRIALVASSDVPVLVLGETGSGKEVVARALHHQGRHPDGPFIRVNCGAIPPELIDSQLFGHEKGSFTGAERVHHGWFERADGGTLFLDEVGELPPEAQVRLLRVLQDGFVERVGGTAPIHVDVRVVAATHRDLAAMVSHREFREDLWYRLAVFPILIPPLRERRDDIPALVQHFAQRASNRFGLPVAEATSGDLRVLQEYDWPGNIRELTAVIDRAAILGAGKVLDISTAMGWSGHATPKPLGQYNARPSDSKQIFVASVSLEDAIKQHIEGALRVCQGRIEGPDGAASMLDVNPHTLRSKMRKLGIDWAQFRP